jgi:hypothetical protein
VQPKDVKAALQESGLWDRVYTLQPGEPIPSLLDIVTPKQKDAAENPRRVILMSEKHGGQAKWLPGTYSLSQETPFTFTSVNQFNCAPNRGKTGKPFFIVNHWLRPAGPPDPAAAGKVNSTATLTKRLQTCISERGALPNALAVDFTSIGDTHGVVKEFNAAIAKVAGVSPSLDRALKLLQAKDGITDAELREIDGYSRLPRITMERARALLGPLADRIARPDLTGFVELPARYETPATRGTATVTTVPLTVPPTER